MYYNLEYYIYVIFNTGSPKYKMQSINRYKDSGELQLNKIWVLLHSTFSNGWIIQTENKQRNDS
jgi:hypothetical protein